MSNNATDSKMEDTEMSNPAGAVDKGKGMAPQAPDAMQESDDSSSEESGAEEQVCLDAPNFPLPGCS